MSFTVQVIGEINQRFILISSAHISFLYELLFSATVLIILSLQAGGVVLI